MLESMGLIQVLSPHQLHKVVSRSTQIYVYMILYVIIYIYLYLKIGPCGKHWGKSSMVTAGQGLARIPRRILAPVEVMSQTFNGFDML